MDKFESEINKVFNFNITEEVEKSDVIEEGFFNKIKDVAKRVAEKGLQVLPKEWVIFAQGLLASAKQGEKAVAEFLSSNPEKAQLLAKVGPEIAAKVGAAIKEDIANMPDVIEEGSEELASAASNAAQTAGDIGGDALTVAAVIAAIASAYGLYKVIRAGIESYKSARAAEEARMKRTR